MIRNLVVRAGADFSSMRQEMNRAGRDLRDFGRRANDSLRRSFGSNFSNGTVRRIEGFSNVARDAVAGLSGELAGLSTAALGAARALGPVGLAIGAVAVAGTAAVVGIGKAAQMAAKFETDLARVNLALGASTTKYMAWAKSMGLARSTAAELGGTYGLLLSSFIKNNSELEKSTEGIVQATRILSSATGKSMDETFERVRSGLLGNTEAIEDLGVYVNVAMIETTNAFKKMANGKSWDKLDFRVQQQIRLQAILEQTTSMYGNSLQVNVMAKQMALSEQLKEMKLNLSQAFLPIWDLILPLLSKLAGALVAVTEQIARFSYWLTGKNYDEATKGTDKQTKATDNLGDSYKEAGEKAKGALAAFDEINQIGDFDGGGSGTGGSGGSGGTGTGGSGGTGSSNDYNLPPLPPLPKMRLEFDPPNPPDAGAGGVAAAVVSTVNNMVAQTRATVQAMWADLGISTTYGLAVVKSEFNVATAVINSGMAVTAQNVSTSWHNMLDYMQSQLNAYNPYLKFGWNELMQTLEGLTLTSTTVKDTWHEMLDKMQSLLNAYEPYIEYGVSLIGNSLSALTEGIKTTVGGWGIGWDAILKAVNTATSPIVSLINSIQGAYQGLMATLGQPITMPSIQFPKIEMPDIAGSIGDALKSVGSGYVGAMDALSQTSFMKWIAAHPELGSGVGAGGGLGGLLGGLESGGASLLSKIKAFLDSLKLGGAVPALAGGGITNGPTLAMIGDNIGGQEVVSPLDGLLDMIQSAVGTAVLAANQMSGGNGGNKGDIVINVDGTTLARVVAPYLDKENNRVGGSMITAM